MTDLIIIGGGASGLALATMVKLLAPTLSVKILEKNDRVAKKLIVTGNGCCNITNQCFKTDKYHGSSPLFAKFSLENFPPQKQALFFESMGVLVDFEADGRAYPLSRQASCVVDALRFSADEQNVGILCNKQALQINHPKDYEVVCSDEVLTCRCVAIACGSIAGGKLGSDFGYRLLKGLGHTINERRPAIVQIKTEPELVRQLKGIKVMANASVLLDNHLQRAEYGEVLFCEYGLSGPPILQLSRIISFNKGAEISLDFMHNKSLETLSSILFARRDILRLRPLSEFLSGMLNKRLGQVILKNCGFDISKDSGSLSDSDILKISSAIKGFRITATGTTGMVNAQAAAGGAATDEFDPKTLMSRKHGGLFAMGEVLDIDGDCGGYNLSWCWSSANTAANGIINFLLH